jgi:hypothetical protein
MKLAKLLAWRPGSGKGSLAYLADSMEIDPSYASSLRTGRYKHRTEAPK